MVEGNIKPKVFAKTKISSYTFKTMGKFGNAVSFKVVTVNFIVEIIR